MSKRLAITAFAAITIVAAVVACGGDQTSAPGVSGASRSRMRAQYASGLPSGLIDHVIIIVQENRTPDYLFQGLYGADISKTGVDYQGETVHLRPESLADNFDPGHGYANFLQDYDNGNMNGWNKGLKGRNRLAPFAYAPAVEVAPYHAMASQYAFADHMFQSNEGSSFPAHLYLVSGSAAATPPPFLVEDDPRSKTNGGVLPGGCDAPPAAFVLTINPQSASPGPTPFPCFDPLVLTDLLDAKDVTWRYYQNNSGAGLWQALDAVRHVRYGPDYADVVWPQTKVLRDIAKNQLPNVSWVIPNALWSDHAGSHSMQGPTWVAAIVNAIGKSQYWDTSVIFVLWDDWGGWYDHVPPPIDNHYELGFRVPLIIISPYAKSAYVSKMQHEFGSILAFTEETFGIPKGSLGTTDVRADDLSDSFNFLQSPRPFTPISAPPFSPSPNYQQHSHEEDP